MIVGCQFIREWPIVCIAKEINCNCISRKDSCRSIGISFNTLISNARVYKYISFPIYVIILKINVSALWLIEEICQCYRFKFAPAFKELLRNFRKAGAY